MAPANNTTKILLAAYLEWLITEPASFLASFFGKNPRELYVSKNELIEIDIERDEELIAVDVVRGADGNKNVVERFTTKEYQPPLYDEETPITATMLNKRRAGMTQYEQEDKGVKFAAIAVKSMIKQTRKIMRSIEKQASEALFDGVITLSNTESLDFKRKATHNITPANPWSDTVLGNPIADLKAACEVNKIDGKGLSNITVMGSTAWDEFVVHPKVTAYLDNRRIEAGVINPQFARDGATFQGVIWVGDYRLEIYTYPQFFKATEVAAATPYVPTAQVAVFDATARLDKAFAAIEVLPEYNAQFNAQGFSLPGLNPAMFVPYKYNRPPKSLMVGVQSAPLIIPTAIDTICNINT